MNYHEQEDSSLIKQWAEREDEDAYFEIYKRYLKKTFRFVNSILKNYHLAEEIAQDTLFTLVEKPNNFLNVSNVGTYFMAIAQNLIRKHFQQKGFEVSIEEPSSQSQVSELNSTDLDPFDAIVTNDNIEVIMEIADGLKLGYKIAFHLDLSGYSDKEIMEIMELGSYKEARNLVQRSRETIKKKFKERFGN